MADANALQYAAPDTQRDAADRLARLHGALELKAALLALLSAPGSRRAARAFEIETADIRPAAGVFEHVRNLPEAARLPWFERLLPRMALHSLPLRQELLQATRRVMGARGVARPIDRLYWVALRRGLGEASPTAARLADSGTDVSEWLETDLLAIASYSAFLARMVPVDESADPGGRFGTEWYGAVMESWQGGTTLPERQPPNGEGAIRALATLETLALAQRPVLVRGWVTSAVRHGPKGPLVDLCADALRLTCRLLDSPMPPELTNHFSAHELDAEPSGPSPR